MTSHELARALLAGPDLLVKVECGRDEQTYPQFDDLYFDVGPEHVEGCGTCVTLMWKK